MFHRVDDIYSMPAGRFLAFAQRIFAYGGVCSLLAWQGHAVLGASPGSAPGLAPRLLPGPSRVGGDWPVVGAAPPDVQVIPSDPASLKASPLGPYIAFKQVRPRKGEAR